jgi:hypothetical protein
MAKFKVLAGSHNGRSVDGEPAKKYRKGDIVVSDQDLDLMFQNKFEKVASGRKTPPPADVVEEPAADTTNADAGDGAGADNTHEAGPGDAEGEVTLLAKHRGQGRWDVVKVIDGVETEQMVNDGFLKKDAAKDMAAAGIEGLEEGGE